MYSQNSYEIVGKVNQHTGIAMLCVAAADASVRGVSGRQYLASPQVALVMDIISQLQEQVNLMAQLTFNTIGTLQRDAPPNRLSPNYPEPPPHPTEDGASFAEQAKQMSTALFDALVEALPISEGDEDAQVERIAKLQAENDAIGQELQKQLEAAEKELNQVRELFSQASDNCLNLKKPE
ncbi:hypothetical protein Lal_00031252 [Lupinus albus]|nr:hypothetical protein Lal_00031252 [Lupinus albus]